VDVVAGRWAVGDPIAHGGQATVHHATHVSLGRPAAIKVFHPHVWADEAFRRRFRRECEALVALEHPNVIPVLDAGESDGTGWIVMHLATGGSLADRLAERGLATDEAIAILRQVARALDAAHSEGRLHRDVKPANVLLEPDGHVWLADFGVARSVGTTTTVPGQMVGTAAYMAPEVIAGGRARPSADLYAFACMAFEMLTGRRPFPDGEVGSVLFAHLERPVPRACAIRPDLPRRIDRVLAAGLAKDPRDRPRSAMALVDALEAALPQPDATMPYMSSPAAPRRRRRMAGMGALAASAVLLMGGAVAGYSWLSGSGGDPAAAVEMTPLPRVPSATGEVTGAEARASEVPGAVRSDRLAVSQKDGAVAYAVNAGPGRTASRIAAATASSLSGQGQLVDRVDLAGGGSALVAHAAADFLLRGDIWVLAEVPGAAPGDPDRVLVVRGRDGAPLRYADDLSGARPAEVIAPG
jgi:tRNA A-37 threonylcarbamoyl transferase component Bud32